MDTPMPRRRIAAALGALTIVFATAGLARADDHGRRGYPGWRDDHYPSRGWYDRDSWRRGYPPRGGYLPPRYYPPRYYPPTVFVPPPRIYVAPPRVYYGPAWGYYGPYGW